MTVPVKVGVILKEYLECRKIQQKDVAIITDSSTRHVSCLINGKQKLSYEYAIKLEKVFPDVKAEFWLDIEQQYQLFKIRLKNRYLYLHFDEDSEEDYEGEYEAITQQMKELGWIE